MKRPHLIAALCFAIATFLYLAGMSTDYFAGFFLLAGFFEVVAWKNVIRAYREKRAAASITADI
jgi:cell division protein FtsW (lipid II flippase)